MELSEQIGDFEEFLRQHFRRYQSGIWTALPLVVNTWNYPTSGKNTVHATPGIAGMAKQPDGSWTAQPMPQLPDVPVHFMGGGGFVFTHPLAQGDEGIGIFSSRCLDSWWQVGGANVARPDYSHEFMHEIGDGMFIPTRMSNANLPPNISQTAAQLRSLDGTSYLEMLGSGGGFNLVTPGQYMRFNGGSGDLYVSGNVHWNDASASTDAAGHVHPNVINGGDKTDPPLPGS